ncbi:MHS family MFS transporter (plasmid) [Rhodococcus sp. USK10]|uniref:MFS transporter n=1 Tax=Rhodococcus sp. USK10 TaxID=2789739 RepID=UPI001C605DE7|nr:MFS transporter [Rhodococcus sp. USK10]QYB00147.1 MHS family MFS transporter [Rhodococcus sp. USK10]
MNPTGKDQLEVPQEDRLPDGVGTSRQQNPWRAAWSALLGSTLEYYDFFVYGTASALVLNKVFFPTGNPTVAAISSLATFGIGYLARPLGAVVFGNLGDRIGRKRVLMLTLAVMGAASMTIALLPTYSQIGALAPTFLVICRLVQGFSAGGEAAGATALTLENSPEGKRAFFTSFTLVGYSAAMVLASLTFVPLTLLPDDAFLSWGWRIPFILGSLILVVAYYLRRGLDETPTFEEAKKNKQLVAIPAVEVFRTHWRTVLRVVFASLFAASQTVISVFGLSYATSAEVGVSKTTMLVASSVAMGITMATVPMFGWISDRVGRRPIWFIGTLGSGASTFLYFWALGTGSTAAVLVASLINMSIFTGMMNGVWTVLFAEMFPAAVRFSGFAIGTQLGFLMAGFTPAIGWSIIGHGGTAWLPVAILGATCAVVAGIAGASGRETYRVPLEELGSQRTG